MDANELRATRSKAGLTQAQMAEKLGISRQHYIRYEKAQAVIPMGAAALARAVQPGETPRAPRRGRKGTLCYVYDKDGQEIGGNRLVFPNGQPHFRGTLEQAIQGYAKWSGFPVSGEERDGCYILRLTGWNCFYDGVI